MYTLGQRKMRLFGYFILAFERESMSGGRAEREGEGRERTLGSLYAVSLEPDVGLELTSCGVMT